MLTADKIRKILNTKEFFKEDQFISDEIVELLKDQNRDFVKRLFKVNVDPAVYGGDRD